MFRVILISIGFLLCGAALHPQSHTIYTLTSIDFTVETQDFDLTNEIATKVEQYVKEITEKWLPEKIPRGMRHTTIQVVLGSYNRAYCTKDLRIYIHSNGEHLDQTLKHELTHALLMIRYPDLPRWTHEGVATSWDGPGHQKMYHNILMWSRQSGTYPRLAEIMRGVRFDSRNATAYTASNSLVKFLLSINDKYTLFLYSTRRVTLERAYGYQNIKELQSAWTNWLNRPVEAQKPSE